MLEYLLLATVLFVPNIQEPCNMNMQHLQGCYVHDTHEIYISETAHNKKLTIYHEFGHHLFMDYEEGLFTDEEHVARRFTLWLGLKELDLPYYFQTSYPKQNSYFEKLCPIVCQDYIINNYKYLDNRLYEN